jgi:hypothetical protein
MAVEPGLCRSQDLAAKLRTTKYLPQFIMLKSTENRLKMMSRGIVRLSTWHSGSTSEGMGGDIRRLHVIPVTSAPGKHVTQRVAIIIQTMPGALTESLNYPTG